MLSTIALALFVGAAPTELTLDNGLRVVIERDTTGPRFALAIAYEAGSLDAPEGRAELAHVTEHMTFIRFADEYTLADARAAEFNGMTLPEHTVYHVADDVRWLERWLWIEAERMRPFEVTQAAFDAEITVVDSEIDQRRTIGGAVREGVEERLYPAATRSPSQAERVRALGALTREDVAWFHRTYYRTNRAVLAVVSPLPVDEVVSIVRAAFDPLRTADIAPKVAHRTTRRGCPAGEVNASSPGRRTSVEYVWLADVEVALTQAMRVERILHRRLKSAIREALPDSDVDSSVWVDRRGLRLSLEIEATGKDIDTVAKETAAAMTPLLAGDFSAEELARSNAAIRARLRHEQQDRPARAVALATGLESDSALELDLARRVQVGLRTAEPVVAITRHEDRPFELKGSKPCE